MRKVLRYRVRMTLTQRIRDWLAARPESWNALGPKIGISPRTIANIVHGKRHPSGPVIDKIIAAIETDKEAA